MPSTPEGGPGKELARRNEDIWKRWAGGESQRSIADHYGVTQATIHNVIRDIRASMPAEDVAERRARLVSVVDEGIARMMEVVRADPVPLYSNGKPVTDPVTGEIARDWSGQANALRVALQASERLARLLGLDAPATVNVNVVAQAREAATTAASEAAARLAAAGRTVPGETVDPDE